MNFARECRSLIIAKQADPSVPADIRDALALILKHATITVSNKMTKAAGIAEWILLRSTHQAILDTLTLKLSNPLMARVSQEERENTYSHEVAHLVQAIQQGTSDHGLRWQSIHRAIGGDGKQYHHISRDGLEKTVSRYEWVRRATGQVYIVKRGQHAALVRSAGYHGAYEFRAEIRVKGKELVARHDAQRAG
jgi:predicted SprT family Zn-dependent metalloprotease